MAVLRSLIAALAILATLLTAGAVGAARGQAMAVGEIALCANGMAVTVPVDANGHPTGAPHWCPDCVLTLLTGLPAAPAMPTGPDARLLRPARRGAGPCGLRSPRVRSPRAAVRPAA